MLQSACLLSAAHSRQAASAQSSPLRSQPLVKTAAMEHSAPPALSLDTKSASAGKADAVQAEFAKVGISTGVIQRILKQHKPYVSWDIESKLRPTLHLWLQLLGTEQLFQQLQKARRLLVWKPCVQARRSVMWCISGCVRGQVAIHSTMCHDKGSQGSAVHLCCSTLKAAIQQHQPSL